MRDDDLVKGLRAPIDGDALEGPWSLLSERSSFPVAVMHREAVRHNLDWMVSYCRAQGVAFAPHGKTPMIPASFRWQIDAGAFAMSFADMRQVRVAVKSGVRRILLANQVIGQGDITSLVDLLRRDPELELCCLVDSVEGVARLAGGVRAGGLQRPLPVLLEGGLAGGRCGVRTLDQGRDVLAALSAHRDVLALRGIEGYEGVVKPAEEGALAKVAAFVDFLCALAREAEAADLLAPGDVLLSAGGTKFHDIVVDRFKAAGLGRPSLIVIRSGCYLFHDHGIYRDAFREMVARSPVARAAGELQPAIEVWAQVLSRPEPGIAILNAGKRDCPYDAGLPTPLRGYRPSTGRWLPDLSPDHAVFALHDQHGYVRVPAASPLAVGDLVALGISHPCTLFDKWRSVLEVDEHYTVLDVHETWF